MIYKGCNLIKMPLAVYAESFEDPRHVLLPTRRVDRDVLSATTSQGHTLVRVGNLDNFCPSRFSQGYQDFHLLQYAFYRKCDKIFSTLY